MPEEIPSLCFSLPGVEVPPLLQRTRRLEYPSHGLWHPDSDAVEEEVHRLANVAFEAGCLWQFTSTNHWHDRMLNDLAQDLGYETLSFLESFYALLSCPEVIDAREAITRVGERLRQDREQIRARGNSDLPELIRQLPVGDPFASALVSRDVDEWSTVNPFGSYVLSLDAALEEALAQEHHLLWYPTHA